MDSEIKDLSHDEILDIVWHTSIESLEQLAKAIKIQLRSRQHLHQQGQDQQQVTK